MSQKEKVKTLARKLLDELQLLKYGRNPRGNDFELKGLLESVSSYTER